MRFGRKENFLSEKLREIKTVTELLLALFVSRREKRHNHYKRMRYLIHSVEMRKIVIDYSGQSLQYENTTI